MTTLSKTKKINPLKVYKSFTLNMILEKICEVMGRNHVTRPTLAKKMNMTKSELSRVFSNERGLSIEEIVEIFYHLGEELEIVTKKELRNIRSRREERLEYIVSETLWMDRRYANGRSTFAPSTVNE